MDAESKSEFREQLSKLSVVVVAKRGKYAPRVSTRLCQLSKYTSVMGYWFFGAFNSIILSRDFSTSNYQKEKVLEYLALI
jgi:hypothetical protein